MQIDDTTLQALQEQTKSNLIIFDSFQKAASVLRTHENIAASISGGADSDIIIDMLTRLDPEKKIHYIWFDTGLEYKATKEHLDFLEQKYGVTIERQRPVKTVPASCMEYGQPFLSKFISEMLCRLQRHGFQWEDEPYEVLSQRYNTGCDSAIKWWCNRHDPNPGFTTSMWNINRRQYLKEFLIAHPPTFKISNKCCTYAKKSPGKKYDKENNIDLSIIGVRKAEGGIRAGLKVCFTDGSKGADVYRPVFWYTNPDKADYETLFGVTHSRCYTEYGLKRTGCVGCPYNPRLLDELAIMEVHEPGLYKACAHVFKDSYEYTRQYREFVAEMKAKEKA